MPICASGHNGRVMIITKQIGSDRERKEEPAVPNVRCPDVAVKAIQACIRQHRYWLLLLWICAGPWLRAQDLSLPEKDPSWKWVHIGIAVQAAGNAADIATSWKQPERTSWLAEKSGPYQDRFYWRGAARKTVLTGAISGLSYVVASRWPRTRKYVGWLNLGLGGVWSSVAVSNYLRNPAFHR